MSAAPDREILVRDFRITPLDSPIGAFLPGRLDWVVVDVSEKDMPDRKGTEVHRFRHWAAPNIYVRIKPPKEQS